MRQSDYRPSIMAAAQTAVATERGEPIVRAIVEDLKLRRVIVPLPDLIERLALAGRAWARRQAYRDLTRDLSGTTRAGLAALLTTRVEPERTQHGWISEVPEGPKLKNLTGVIARLQVLRRVGLADDRRKSIHANRYSIIAREARVTPARELLRFTPERQCAVLVAFAIERQAALTDLAVEMFDRLIGTARRRAATKHDERLLAQARTLIEVAQVHVVLGRALMDARKAGTDLAKAVEQALGWDRLGASVETAARAAGANDGDGLDEMIGRFLSLRRIADVRGIHLPLPSWGRRTICPKLHARAESVQVDWYPACSRYRSHSSGGKRFSTSPMARHVASTVRASCLRSRVLSLANTCSIGLRSGL
jgi:hypothetical protein